MPCAVAALAGAAVAFARPFVGPPVAEPPVVSAQPAQRSVQQSDRPTVCHPERSTRTDVSPSRIRRAEKAIVTSSLSFSCPAPIEPFHTVLVTDAALVASDAGVRDSLAALPVRVALRSNAFARIGRIDFGPGARTMCGVINDPDEVARCLSGEGVDAPDPALRDPEPALADAIRQARIRLVHARDDDPPSVGNPVRAPKDVIVVVAGEPTVPDEAVAQAELCAAVAPSLAEAAAAGIEVRLACADGACAETCLADAVRAATGRSDGGRTDSGRNDTVRSDTVGLWRDAVEELVVRAWATEARVWRLVVREGLNRTVDMRGRPTKGRVWSVVPDSLDPPIPHARESNALQWTLTQPMSKTVTLTYHVLPQMEHGTFALRQSGEYGAVAIVQDTRGGFGLYRLNNPEIVVAGWGPFVAFLPLTRRTWRYEHSY